jgi:hypothetical protein
MPSPNARPRAEDVRGDPGRRLVRGLAVLQQVQRVVLAVTTPEERATIGREGGLVLRLPLAVLVPPFQRRERAVFGDRDVPRQASSAVLPLHGGGR